MFRNHAPGLFVVRYRERSDLAPARQGPLVEALREASRGGRVGVVFDVGPAVHWVGVSVPRFWLRMTADPSLRIGAMAIVTGSIAIELAVGGFAAASAIRRTGLRVRTFPGHCAAVAWVRGALGEEPRLATT